MPSPQPEPCVLVIFGASGDLTRRKLVPALYELDQRGQLPDGLCVLGVARSGMDDTTFRTRLRTMARELVDRFDEASWSRFARRLFYQQADATDSDDIPAIARRIQALGEQFGLARPIGGPNVLFYLSVSPVLYEPIVAAIGAAGLVTEGKRWCALDPAAVAWQRIIVEKPFGESLASARSLNRALGRVFEEESIYRIDHYLGKELVQNLLVLRFANSIFEPIWNRVHVDHVQVTAAETLGVGARAASYYDQAGALRDMIQSHLIQVAALVGIEPPATFAAESIMREKIALLHAVRAPEAGQAARCVAFGRYGPDPRRGEPAYVDEPGVDPARRTETYAALRLEFDTWRWAGVPFYLRTGKKLARKVTEVVVQFREPPTDLFRGTARARAAEANRLLIHIAPREGISLVLRGKVPGTAMTIDTASLDLDYQERFGGQPMEAYGPLLLDAMRGDRTLYKHREEVEAAWKVCQPVLDDAALRASIEDYPPGSWGPAGADALLAREGRRWHNEPGESARGPTGPAPAGDGEGLRPDRAG